MTVLGVMYEYTHTTSPSQLWASARAAAASIVQQVEARARRKRAAEGREGEDDARARVRRRASGGDGDDDAMIL